MSHYFKKYDDSSDESSDDSSSTSNSSNASSLIRSSSTGLESWLKKDRGANTVSSDSINVVSKISKVINQISTKYNVIKENIKLDDVDWKLIFENFGDIVKIAKKCGSNITVVGTYNATLEKIKNLIDVDIDNNNHYFKKFINLYKSEYLLYRSMKDTFDSILAEDSNISEEDKLEKKLHNITQKIGHRNYTNNRIIDELTELLTNADNDILTIKILDKLVSLYSSEYQNKDYNISLEECHTFHNYILEMLRLIILNKDKKKFISMINIKFKKNDIDETLIIENLEHLLHVNNKIYNNLYKNDHDNESMVLINVCLLEMINYIYYFYENICKSDIICNSILRVLIIINYNKTPDYYQKIYQEYTKRNFVTGNDYIVSDLFQMHNKVCQKLLTDKNYLLCKLYYLNFLILNDFTDKAEEELLKINNYQNQYVEEKDMEHCLIMYYNILLSIGIYKFYNGTIGDTYDILENSIERGKINENILNSDLFYVDYNEVLEIYFICYILMGNNKKIYFYVEYD